MQDIIFIFLILTVIFKVVDFSNLETLDYVLLTLFILNTIVGIVTRIIKTKRQHREE